jgi:hypothetical protein
MSRRKRPFIYCSFIAIFFILLLALAISCSEQPTGVQNQPGDTGGFIGEGGIDPGAGGKFLLGTVEDTTFAPGHIEVWAMDVAYDGNTGNISFDVQLGNSTERPIPAPVHFVIISVVPSDISVVDFDGISEDGFPFYDFSSKLGSDNILEPGEISDRATMRFHTGEPRSFSLGFRIDFGLAQDTGIIAGVVFRDDNRNGVRDQCDMCEPGISGITITMQRGIDKGAENLFITRTDANGEYRFSNLKEGVYTVRAQVPSALWEITSPNPLLVTLIKGLDGKVQDFYGANFGFFFLHSEGLLLWNKLGSREEVENSEVGPNGVIAGDIEYLPCKYGLGFKPLPRTGDHNIPDNFIDFEALNLGNQGCIEFWYLPDYINGSVGNVVELFRYGIAEDVQNWEFIGICFNDWQNKMCINSWDLNRTARVYMTQVPASIPGWSTTEPFHIALTWDGTAPVVNDKLKFYVNGQQVMASYGHNGDPTFDDWLPDAVLRLGSRLFSGDWDRHHWEGDDAVIDNVKVWNYPKTDFSDRFNE